MRKLILLLILAGLSWWYFDYSRRMTEAQVREAYTLQIDAIQQFDAQRQCAQIADDFQGNQVVRQGSQSIEKHYDKKGLCTLITHATEMAQRMSAATGGMLELKVDIEIKSIELTTNRKQATVQTVSTVRLGDMTLSRDRATDQWIRRNGRVLVIGSDSKAWAYAPQ
ncbi:hypothetical protein [Dyella sp. ASV21]|uniref:hypothetical protein n=1 Tax=Dyella sp. ASV21 TaxID=2795114 RepID=UPI0018ECF359|nr:hypothetical protein [Dyella sp. ASV21]